ncbi:glycosyltransferase family 2 protein [Pedobacter deserti]|uniref:glycosyltransferase family 2 protein n=1 Tax=Pedobacter deserti TaxID=2817382 RepID=UPI002108D45C|nr:glycosyltransferase family 2 protein [Pedobacter sp. SYSU D00382]
MKNQHISFIVLTLNEQMHLPRLFDSIRNLNSQIYVLDSGSSDETLTICEKYGAEVKYHPFENHPKQWNAALHAFQVNTPWVICLDADQYIAPDLSKKLTAFSDAEYATVNGIYFNRKNYFQGKWIRYGGYYPKYMLKMFRYTAGFSDLSEAMDHRFQVPGRTLIWKNAHIIEENLKENKIHFWIEKHNRYSDLLAESNSSNQSLYQAESRIFGNPNERNAWCKKIWADLPLLVRPFLYYFYRLIFRLGILDGIRGNIFHFLQAFWFRLIVDIKILESRKCPEGPAEQDHQMGAFLCRFMIVFAVAYCINLAPLQGLLPAASTAPSSKNISIISKDGGDFTSRLRRDYCKHLDTRYALQQQHCQLLTTPDSGSYILVSVMELSPFLWPSH